MKEPMKCVLMVRESLWQSALSDAVTFMMIFTVIGIGKFLESPAMQWCGFAMLCVIAVGRMGRECRITPQQASDQLFDRYGVQPTMTKEKP